MAEVEEKRTTIYLDQEEVQIEDEEEIYLKK